MNEDCGGGTPFIYDVEVMSSNKKHNFMKKLRQFFCSHVYSTWYDRKIVDGVYYTFRIKKCVKCGKEKKERLFSEI